METISWGDWVVIIVNGFTIWRQRSFTKWDWWIIIYGQSFCFVTVRNELIDSRAWNRGWSVKMLSFIIFAWLLQPPALSHSKYMVISQSAQEVWYTQLMDFRFDWWTWIGVSTSIIMLMTESTMWDMLEGFYLDILSVTSFFIKNIYFSSINRFYW